MPEIKNMGAYSILLVKGEKRGPHEITRRTDFGYMGGRGTFYRFARKHPPKKLLTAKKGQLVSLVLYNKHTRQLDEVVFALTSKLELELGFKFDGIVDGTEGYFSIEGHYWENKKARRKCEILVSPSALPMPFC